MKIKHLLISLSTLALFSCGGGQNNGGGAGNQAPSIDTISAFELYKKFNPELADKHKDADTSGKLYYSFYDPESYNEFGGPFINLYYLNLNDGGHLIVYQHTENGMLDDDGSSQIHLFRYINGELSEADDLLPTPSFNDFAQLEGLTFYNPEQRLIDFFDKKDFSYCYELDPKTMLVAVRIYVFNDPLSLYYKWDGSKFVLDSKRDPETPQNLICFSGLGRVLLGDNPPDEILGFQKNTLGKTVYFNRNGQKMFKLSLDANDKIDTITVLSPLYTFRIDCDGPTNDHFGIGYKPVDFCSNDDFVCKDGVWIRRFTGGYDYFCGIINDTRKADSLNVIEFYTTKDAITNIEPEDGKTVNWHDHPEYNPNATVTQVKIYQRQPETSTGEAHIALQFWKEMLKEYDPLGMLDGDEMPSAEMIASNLENVKEKSDNIATYVAEGAEGFEETVICFKRNDGSYVVMKYFDPKTSSPHRISMYNFRNGKITWDETTDLMLPEHVVKQEDPGRYTLNDGYYIKRFTNKGYYVVGQGGDGYNCEWNGERIIDPSME